MGLPKNIVVVEDEVITQRYIQDVFAQYDVSVSACFDNGKEMLEHISQISCDMILMDINLKGPMDGIQLAQRLLQNHTFPIIFITAHNDDATLDELLELAPYGFIGKPFSSKELISTVKIAYKRFLIHSRMEPAREKEKKTDVLKINKKYTYAKEEHILFADDEVVRLNRNQSLLIAMLSEEANHVVPYERIIYEVWGNEEIADSALRTLVYSVRKLLPDLPIVSHSKMGYTLVCE